MTPWHLFEALKATNESLEREHKEKLYAAYTGAWLARCEAKRFPKTFREMLGENSSKGIDEDAIKAQMQIIRERAQRGNNSRKDGGRPRAESGEVGSRAQEGNQ